VTRKNSTHARLRQLAKRHGSAGMRGGMASASLTAAKPFRPAPAKQKLRQEAEAALAAFTGTIQRCPPARGKRGRL
jgi:hypothetical protein